ncbi:MAG: hypothetical protein M1817_004384 [Caeruleum heppii]|nr:MAG: hypothetical protein M1817_004384 [Caeruleum heppii]
MSGPREGFKVDPANASVLEPLLPVAVEERIEGVALAVIDVRIRELRERLEALEAEALEAEALEAEALGAVVTKPSKVSVVPAEMTDVEVMETGRFAKFAFNLDESSTDGRVLSVLGRLLGILDDVIKDGSMLEAIGMLAVVPDRSGEDGPILGAVADCNGSGVRSNGGGFSDLIFRLIRAQSAGGAPKKTIYTTPEGMMQKTAAQFVKLSLFQVIAGDSENIVVIVPGEEVTLKAAMAIPIDLDICLPLGKA